MRIIGIDPGYAIVGFGVVDYIDGKFSVKDFGAITTDKDTPFPKRLCEIYEDYCQILDSWKPDALSIERLYFTNNQKTGIDVAQARGIIIMAAAQQAVVGYGQAVKKQVQEMTKNILKLPFVPKPDDTADALAMTICHAQTSGSLLRNIKASNI